MTRSKGSTREAAGIGLAVAFGVALSLLIGWAAGVLIFPGSTSRGHHSGVGMVSPVHVDAGRPPCIDAIYAAALAEWGWTPGPEQLVLATGERRTSAVLRVQGRLAQALVREAATISDARWQLLDDLTGFYREAEALGAEEAP